MKTTLFLLFAGATALVQGPWSDVSKTPDERAHTLVSAMTIDEKLAMLHGPPTGPCCQCTTNATCAYIGNVVPNTRLGIPSINMNDGPQGFRTYNDDLRTTTAWPSGLTMAASWDRSALSEWGTGMGKEFYAKGANVQLGPGLCLARVPKNGRNFEYLSGEDPFLGSQLVQPVITGIQSQKVIANAKHYVLNNQETNRGAVIADTDERTRFEMYYPPFRGATDAGVGSVMCSYNKVSDHKAGDKQTNGLWSCENPLTLGGDLKTRTGFKGWVMSDWGATHSTSIMAGLDQEMPSAKYMNPDAIKAGMAAKNISQAAVDDSVFRMLRAMFDVGVMDEPEGTYTHTKLKVNATTEASVASARRLSAASTVLLQNEGSVLPLPSDGSAKKIAVLGFGDVGAITHGGGSGAVSASYIATPLSGVTNALSGTTTEVAFNNGTDIAAAADLAAGADYAVVFVGTLSHEGGDRASLSLDDGCDPSSHPETDNIGYQCQGNHAQQNALVAAVAKANKKTVVVASVPGAVLMPWKQDVAAILVNFMPGQQAGNAISDVLFGKVNPSGRLPLTFPNREDEQLTTPEQWPGMSGSPPKVDFQKPTYSNYTEGLLVGYRWYDAKGIDIDAGFPFGHGLSYTTFAHSNLAVDGTTVSVDVTNTGKRAGSDVVQLYLGFPASAGEPPKQLKGFEKLQLAPGAKTTVQFKLEPRDLSIWDVASHDWSVVKGKFGVFVGASSRDPGMLSGSLSN